ncbi:MAG: membrane protein insertase YidC [bacterium]|nr:membrane protein insertase YidC [bacterium]
MDNNRKQLAILFILFLVFTYKVAVWDPYFSPKAVEDAALKSASVASVESGLEQDKGAVVGEISRSAEIARPVVDGNSSEEMGLATEGAVTGEFEVPSDDYFIVETAELRAEIALHGGTVRKLFLREYKETNKKKSPLLNLVQGSGDFEFVAGSQSDAGLNYRLEDSEFSSGKTYRVDSGEKVFRLVAQAPGGGLLSKFYSFSADGYFFDLQVSSKQDAALSLGSKLYIKRVIGKDDPSLHDNFGGSGLAWYDGEKVHREGYPTIKEGAESFSAVRWLGLGDKYFSTTLVAPEAPLSGGIERQAENYRAYLNTAASEVSVRIFTGPKSYQLLENADYDLRKLINFGWTGFVAAPLLLALHMFYSIFGNFGVAIVVLTISVKLLLYPLSAVSFKSMKAMQDLQPDMKRIRETISDKALQQQELMALYKRKGVNPMGGCLPMLMQIPIFFGLYSALQLDIELRHAPFAFWINDLSAKENFEVFGYAVPVMVILLVVSMVVQQWITPSTADPAQKKMMMFMPFVMGFLFMGFPAGLTLYWLTNNLISIAQTQGLHQTSEKNALAVTLATGLAVFSVAFVLAQVG